LHHQLLTARAIVAQSSAECDPIQLAIFSHRFMSIAEQMGRALQRTSISVNIKERLDFSCALFGTLPPPLCLHVVLLQQKHVSVSKSFSHFVK
jgi:hypothetical protein